MQLATFQAQCDVEIGDQVKFAGSVDTKITDIRCINYVASGKTEFEFELALFPTHGLWCKREDFVYEPVPAMGYDLPGRELTIP